MDYYLPDGRWTNLLTGEAKDGGHWTREVILYDNGRRAAAYTVTMQQGRIAVGTDSGKPYRVIVH